MKRKLLDKLVQWKNSTQRLPLIIRGARQVGKTWLMKEFGNNYFVNAVYINFENNSVMQEVFNTDFDIDRILTSIKIHSGVSFSPENDLIIFDEIQECPRAVTALKYFRENAPQCNIVAAGSLLGVAMHEGTSFPVGKVEFLDLYPLSFTEFLEATGQHDLLQLIQDCNWDLVKSFRPKFVELLKQYYFVGGMPEVVKSFVNENDYVLVRHIQGRLLTAYEQDFSKHAPNDTVPRIRMVWDSVPAQLARENRKFIYGALRSGARAREFELAMQWLLDCGLLHKVVRVHKPDMPLSAYQNTAFKLFMLDVGLLSAKSGLDQQTLLEGNRIFTEFKGSLTEQYVLQQLVSDCDIKPCYWSAEGGIAEIDFVFQHKMNVYPLEVKAEENLKAKSLSVYSKKYSPEISLRASMSNYRREEWLVNLPLYAISQIEKIATGL